MPTEPPITDWAFPGRGLIRGNALADYVREEVGNRPFDKLRIPLGIVATGTLSFSSSPRPVGCSCPALARTCP